MAEASEQKSPVWAERFVQWMDDGVRLPGTDIHFGLDAIIGTLLPGVGDALSALTTLSLFWLAAQRQVPRAVLVRMAVNVAIDAMVGSVPVFGDVFDLFWKANRKNLVLIERSLPSSNAQVSPLRDKLFLWGLVPIVCGLLALPAIALGFLLHALFTHI